MRSAAQRRHSIANLIRAGMLRRKRYISIEDCDRVDVPQLLAALPATDEEKARNFAGRFAQGQRFVLTRKRRWKGVPMWHLWCPQCCSHREYLLKRRDDPPNAPFRCRRCVGATWLRRRYHAKSLPANAPQTHRASIRLARERRRRDKLLAPVVREERRKRDEAEARERRLLTNLARKVIRKVAARGAVEAEVPQREAPSLKQLGAMVRAARPRAEIAKGLDVSQ